MVKVNWVRLCVQRFPPPRTAFLRLFISACDVILGVVRRRSVHKAGYGHNRACAAASPVMAGGIEEALRIIAMLGVP